MTSGALHYFLMVTVVSGATHLKCKQELYYAMILYVKSLPVIPICILTKCHPPADNLWRLLHVIDGGNGKTPVGYWAPKVLLKNEGRKKRKSEDRA